jgi:hypothetical protein
MDDQPKPIDPDQPKAAATRTRPSETLARYLERAAECNRLVGELRRQSIRNTSQASKEVAIGCPFE